MRIRRTANQWGSPLCRPLQTDLGQFSDLCQSSDKLRTYSYFGPRPDFEHKTSDFGLLTLNFTLKIGQTSNFRHQNSNFKI